VPVGPVNVIEAVPPITFGVLLMVALSPVLVQL
jgi:hypothetical protein